VANIDVLMAQADVAMYSAKRDGRGGFALYNPRMTLPGARDLQLRDPLRHAIATGAIEAVYQPIVELRSGRVVAFEALARWRHEGKSIPPTVFIPIAARAGLLSDLTYHVLELAGAQLAAWSARLGRQRLQVSVNIPPSLFGDQEFPGRVEACIRRHGLGREQVVLEITEDALLADPLAARGVARRLHEMGATLSLDDFGTGYSSLLHLQHIPLHSIKIDRGFTHDLDTNPETERFMHALLALGRDLGLRVIVEGVERATQAEMLRRLGCQLAQGYLFGRPAHPLE
jgi:EAL domain-containing protein (putative c-di-GMP-specific phosphodiesterase class I)